MSAPRTACVPPRRERSADVTTPLAPWLGGMRGTAPVRRAIGRRPFVLRARGQGWREVAPTFDACVAMAASGLPFQIAAERRYDRAGAARRLRPALAAGKTVFLPQVHQVLPRLMRLIVALRVAFMGGGRDEASFLFIVEGMGREGIGLHHDGEVDAVWLQLEGRRTVTLGPRVPRGTPEDLPEGTPRVGRGWTVLDLAPGSLLHLPPRTPHEVVCYGRSLAVSLTWGRRRRPGSASALLQWDVVSGHVDALPPPHPAALWAQVPALARRAGDGVDVLTADGERVRLGARVWPVASALVSMPRIRARPVMHSALAPLVAAGILGPQDLPLRVTPQDAGALDGWRFA